MIHKSVLPEHMPLTDCLSYVYIVSKLGVLFQVHIGEIRVILDRFSLGWLSGLLAPFPCICVAINEYCICSRVPDATFPLENRLVSCRKQFI